MYRREAELIQSARQGDDEAFGELIRPEIDRAYHLALRTLGRPPDAEEAVQDALYKAWQALPQFRGTARFSTWLHKIVWRTCMDRVRKKGDSLPLDVDLPDESAAFDPAVQWEGRETRDEVERALARLDVRYRAVLVLFYIEELSLREVAKVLDLPIGTVKTHLHRARRAIRAELERLPNELRGGRTDAGRK